MEVERKYQEWAFWQESMELVELLCDLEIACPKEGMSDIGAHLRKAAVSVPANIAEGAAKGGGYTANHLRHAKGSICEVNTLLQLVQRMNLAGDGDLEKLLELTDSIYLGLSRFIKAIPQN